ncbi:TetR/AcrR family transcriptional regulator [Streptosporangium sp. NPDC051023]|uniref:TetR/AcrR family transcriptional regulator n=1 Tax=Streptosporangium sp. NPDC051023 TaxID=3155410 RepID=UPI00344EA86B
MARPRKITDERLLEAAGTAIARFGPAFVLADVAAEAGVTPGTLVHRFGSKHGLLVAMIDAAIESTRSGTAAEAGDVEDPVTVIRQEIVERYAPLDDPRAAANNLAQLAFDLSDEVLRARMADLHAAIEARIEPLLAHAAHTGDLPGAPPAPVAARILAALADGTAIRWSANPRGGLCARLRDDLDAVLAGWATRHPPNQRRMI